MMKNYRIEYTTNAKRCYISYLINLFPETSSSQPDTQHSREFRRHPHHPIPTHSSPAGVARNVNSTFTQVLTREAEQQHARTGCHAIVRPGTSKLAHLPSSKVELFVTSPKSFLSFDSAHSFIYPDCLRASLALPVCTGSFHR